MRPITYTDLEEAYANKEHVTHLDLRSSNLKKIPTQLAEFPKLLSLNLMSNPNLKDPYFVISELTNLEMLNLDYCQMTDRDLSDLGSLVNLKKLYLNQNHLSVIPSGISKMKNLDYLSVQCNKIESIPNEIKELQSLKQLLVSENQIKEIPEAIFELKSLIYLDISNNLISEVPEKISQLKNLRDLDLGYSLITGLPDSLSKLKNLRKLTVSGNDFSEFPKSLFDLERLGEVYGLEKYEENKYWGILIHYCIREDGPMYDRKKFLDLLLKRKEKVEFSALQLLEMMNSKFVALRNSANAYLFKMYQATKPQPLQKDSELVILGKTSFNKTDLKKSLKKHEVKYSPKLTDKTSHILLTDYPKKYEDIKFGEVTFITEKEVSQFLVANEDHFLLDKKDEKVGDSLDKIKTLLLNEQAANVQLGLQMIKTGGFHNDLLNEVFIASKSASDAKVRKAARKLLDINVSAELKESLKQRSGLITAWKKEQTAYDNLIKYCEGTELDGVKIAWHVMGTRKLGIKYIWDKGSEDEIRKSIQLSIKGHTLNLKEKQLKKITPILVEFPKIKHLNLSDCDLNAFPEVILELPNLEKLNLEENNIGTLPKELTQLKKLKTLSLVRNTVSEFPQVCLEMESLEELKLSYYADTPVRVANVPDQSVLDEKGLKVSIEEIAYSDRYMDYMEG